MAFSRFKSVVLSLTLMVQDDGLRGVWIDSPILPRVVFSYSSGQELIIWQHKRNWTSLLFGCSLRPDSYGSWVLLQDMQPKHRTTFAGFELKPHTRFSPTLSYFSWRLQYWMQHRFRKPPRAGKSS